MKNKFLLLFLISNLVFIACNSNAKKEDVISENGTLRENSIEKATSSNTIHEIWQNLPVKQFPVHENTNFNNVKIKKELGEKEILLLKLNEIYPNYNKLKYIYIFQAAYKLEFSEKFYSIVVHVSKGDHELETVLLNYSLDEKLTDFKVIAYDEIAESISQKTAKIEKNFVTIIDKTNLEETKIEITKFHINTSGEFNKVKDIFTSTIRPNEAILLNKTYIDTIDFQGYNDDGDYKLLFGKKDYQDVILTYKYDWEAEKKYNFLEGETIQITWKMDSIWQAGDSETLDFIETVIQAKAMKSNETQKYIEALKDFLIQEWKFVQKSNSDIKDINFNNNILTVEGNEGFDLSSYDFDDIKIIKSDKTKKINITIYNVGGGGGGNVVVSETYILTTLNSKKIDVKKGTTKLMN